MKLAAFIQKHCQAAFAHKDRAKLTTDQKAALVVSATKDYDIDVIEHFDGGFSITLSTKPCDIIRFGESGKPRSKWLVVTKEKV
jgi:hypothetical protein